MTTSGAVRTSVPRRGRPRRRLLGAAAMVLIGAWMPWIYTGVGSVVGIRGAGLWTMYAAVLGIAGAALRRRPRWASVHAAVLASVAVGLAVWQVVHLVSLVGFAGWMPGPGLVLTLGGGVLAATVAWSLWSSDVTGESAGA